MDRRHGLAAVVVLLLAEVCSARSPWGQPSYDPLAPHRPHPPGHGGVPGWVPRDLQIEALESVPTAIACFARTPESYEATVSSAIFLGGDTDTIAAMAGALSGAWLGTARLPQRLVGLLESSPRGRDYLVALARRLLAAYERRRGMAAGDPA
jgi:hypothetical protein